MHILSETGTKLTQIDPKVGKHATWGTLTQCLHSRHATSFCSFHSRKLDTSDDKPSESKSFTFWQQCHCSVTQCCQTKQAVGGRPPRYAPAPLIPLWAPKRLARPSRRQHSSSFSRPTRSHAHPCSCLTRQHGGE